MLSGSVLKRIVAEQKCEIKISQFRQDICSRNTRFQTQRGVWYLEENLLWSVFVERKWRKHRLGERASQKQSDSVVV